ncbi:hypothetical protein [Parerythrobacter aestuarii]|uniref:hypothetical protein n=1 Tax=Parerythrobacter aestuarii TaxID=3020909 RepID=UPI0024DE0EEA|nr:hypothetical protein [Parerythrobacter aestuarii]
MNFIVLIGSLVAILALAGLAQWLGLGRTPQLANEADACRAANEAVEGFQPVRFGLDRSGRGGLLEDAQGRILLLKPHGNFFAGRLLAPGSTVLARDETLTIDCGERRYGTVILQLDDPAYWAEAIDRLQAAA